MEALKDLNLDSVIGGIKISELDKAHQNMLKVLQQKLDRASFEELLNSLKDANLEEARALIEKPYMVHAGF